MCCGAHLRNQEGATGLKLTEVGRRVERVGYQLVWAGRVVVTSFSPLGSGPPGSALA